MNFRLTENVARAAIVFMLIYPFVWDIFVWMNGEPDLTITAVFARWSRQQPWLPFALGFLTGHLLFSGIRVALNGHLAGPQR